MSDESILDRMEQDASRALVQNAFFRLESVLTISGALLLSVFFNQPFPWWPVWAWPVIGLLAEIAVVASSLTDKSEQRKVIEMLFREKYNTSGIRDRQLRAKLAEAEQYRQRIQQVIDQQRSGILRDRLVDTTRQVYDWIANMVKLARHIDDYRADGIIRRDLQTVPRELESLAQRIKKETDARVRQQLANTMESTGRLAENLRELQGRMARADLQLDHSLAALGTVYSQMLLVGSNDVDSNRTERLRDDIRQEVLALQDIVASLNEVYQGVSDTEQSSVADSVRRRQNAARG